jgi:hypothetical protein
MGNGECFDACSVHSPLPIPHSPLKSCGSVGNGRPPRLRTGDAVGSNPTRATETVLIAWPAAGYGPSHCVFFAWRAAEYSPHQVHLSSRSSPECSPACHAGDRGFESHRGRCLVVRFLGRRPSTAPATMFDCLAGGRVRPQPSWNTARYAIWKSGEAQTFVNCLSVRSRPVLLVRSFLRRPFTGVTGWL